MKDILLKNTSLKIIALLSAAVFWFIVLGLQDIPQAFDQPLEIKTFNLSDQYAVVEDIPTAKITILADKGIELRPEDFEVYIDLKNANIGTVTSSVLVTSKNPKVNVTGVKPESVTVTLEKKFEKQVPVVADIQGKINEKFQIKSTKITPDRVTIQGTESRISGIREVKVPIHLTGQETASFSGVVAPSVDNQGKPLSDIRVTPEKIEVAVEISSALQEKVVPIHPRLINALKSGYIGKMTVKPATVTVQGDTKALDRLSAVETEPVDLDKIQKSGSVFVNLQLPKDVKTTAPLRIELSLEIIDTKS